MTASTITTYLKYMQLQVVAEAFLIDEFGHLLIPETDKANQSLCGKARLARVIRRQHK